MDYLAEWHFFDDGDEGWEIWVDDVMIGYCFLTSDEECYQFEPIMYPEVYIASCISECVRGFLFDHPDYLSRYC